eukprot:2509799-Pyramimonas_sp.AAC.3
MASSSSLVIAVSSNLLLAPPPAGLREPVRSPHVKNSNILLATQSKMQDVTIGLPPLPPRQLFEVRTRINR